MTPHPCASFLLLPLLLLSLGLGCGKGDEASSTSCPSHGTNKPGNETSGQDTRCDDACSPIFGVLCGQMNQTYLKALNTNAADSFGSPLALDGDTLVVSAPFEASSATGSGGDQTDNSAQSSGAVYVFTRSGTTWSQQAYLKASNTEAYDSFGSSVALDGDTLIVGAPAEGSSATGVGGDQTDNSAQSSGAVYVFTRSGTNWTQQAYLKASNAQEDDNFGRVLGLDGDTLVVGAPFEASRAIGSGGDQTDNSAESSGAVYVFARSGTTWSQQAYLKASNTEAGDAFGAVLALDGDTLSVAATAESSIIQGVVGGDQKDNSAQESGAVYVFTRSGTTWSQQAYLKASNTGAGDVFGAVLALDGDTLVVGAPFEDSSATGVDGDQANNLASNSGAVYVFIRNGTSWSQQAYLKASNADVDDLFGAALALDGDTLVVGTPFEDSGATGFGGAQTDNSVSSSGAAYLFTRSGTIWTQHLYLKASNAEEKDGFGRALALDGDTLVVGASGEDSKTTGADGDQTNNSALSSGAAYVYSGSSHSL